MYAEILQLIKIPNGKTVRHAHQLERQRTEIVECPESPCPAIDFDGFDVIVDPSVCRESTITGDFEVFGYFIHFARDGE